MPLSSEFGPSPQINRGIQPKSKCSPCDRWRSRAGRTSRRSRVVALAAATAEPPSKTEAASKEGADYRKTVLVGKTDFSQRANAAKRELALGEGLSAAFYAAYGFTGAFGRNLCKFTFPQRRRNLRKSLLKTTRPTGVKRAQKWLR